MESWSANGIGRLIFVRMDYGDEVLEQVQEAIAEHGIRNGVVISGIATFKNTRLHQVQDMKYPPTEAILELDEPVEVMNIDGIIADGQSHLHATVAKTDGSVYGGHIESGCVVLYLGELCIAEVSDVQMRRSRDLKTNLLLLGRQQLNHQGE